MCGIAGIVGPTANEHVAALQQMVQALGHRGPDGNGMFISPSGHCLLGHTRLAVLDLTDAAAQPMRTASGRHTLVYNGECYNFRELAEHSEPRPRGDTEVILRLLERKGATCLPEINGMFALALWDEQAQSLLLARDRFGQKPLYYGYAKGCLWFASEVRALLAGGAFPRHLNMDTVSGFLATGSVPDCIVEGIHSVPPACSLTATPDGPVKTASFWSPDFSKKAYEDEEVRALFSRAVSDHLLSDVPLGVFLSGGLDSAAVCAAIAHTQGADAVTALTVMFPELEDKSEHHRAQWMARHLGVTSRLVELRGKDLREALPLAFGAQDQPSIDGVNTWLISKAAHEAGLTVALSGLGADELFGGYPVFRTLPRLIRFKRWTGKLLSPTSRIIRRSHPFSKYAAKWESILGAKNKPKELYQVSRQLFSPYQQKMLLGEHLPSFSRDLDEPFVAGLALEDQIAWWEMQHYMGPTLLRDADSMSMAHGFEIRMPFLDARFAEAALALPSAVRRPTRFPKESWARILGDWLPPDYHRHPKQGFTLPFESWLSKDLSPFAEEGLAALKAIPDLFEANAVDALWHAFLKAPSSVGAYRPLALVCLGHYLRRHQLTPA